MVYYKFLRLESIYYFCEIDYIFKTEQWKDVIGYEGLYMVSDLGRVKSIDRIVAHLKNGRLLKGKILKQKLNIYLKVGVSKCCIHNPTGVHVLVSMAFLKHVRCGLIKVINHKNLNKLDNRLLNLEIVTQRENSNMKHLKSVSKYTGVHKQRHMWRATIWINKKRIHLGMFTSEYDAHMAYENKLATLV